MGKEQKASVPKEAHVMAAILKDMGVTDYEPGVVNQMLEFTYRKSCHPSKIRSSTYCGLIFFIPFLLF